MGENRCVTSLRIPTIMTPPAHRRRYDAQEHRRRPAAGVLLRHTLSALRVGSRRHRNVRAVDHRRCADLGLWRPADVADLHDLGGHCRELAQPAADQSDHRGNALTRQRHPAHADRQSAWICTRVSRARRAAETGARAGRHTDCRPQGDVLATHHRDVELAPIRSHSPQGLYACA